MRNGWLAFTGSMGRHHLRCDRTLAIRRVAATLYPAGPRILGVRRRVALGWRWLHQPGHRACEKGMVRRDPVARLCVCAPRSAPVLECRAGVQPALLRWLHDQLPHWPAHRVSAIEIRFRVLAAPAVSLRASDSSSLSLPPSTGSG